MVFDLHVLPHRDAEFSVLPIYPLVHMHIDAQNIEEGKTLRADICVVGAGAAGITLAKSLAGTSLDVLLLEGGGLDSDDGAKSLYEGENTGLSYYPLSEARMRGLGGSTNLWGGYCAPIEPIVFEKRPWVPYSGWPICREDLDPYYAAAQRILKVGPFRYEPEYWEKAVPEYRRLLPASSTVENRVVQFSVSQYRESGANETGWVDPTRFGELFRQEILEAENVTVVTHANVTNIETPPSASTVSSLEVRRLDGTPFQAEADRYVLACGGIENPRLLLSSDQHAPGGLGNEHDLVGRFFMEHPHIPSASLRLSSPRALNAYRLHFSLYAHRFHFESRPPFFHLKVGRDVQQSERILNSHLRLDARSSGLRSAQALWRKMRSTSNGSRGASEIWREIRGMWADPAGVASGLQRVLPGNDSRSYRFGHLNVLTIAEQAPNPESRVTLRAEQDALGQRKPALDWQLSELDKRSVLRLNEIFAREMERAGEGHLQISDWIEDKTAWNPDEPADPSRYMLEGPRPPRFWGARHHMGTTRMAESPSQGVCDENCRVYGVENLYVAGSSLFPTVGSAPPTLTIVALAVRLADHLSEQQRD